MIKIAIDAMGGDNAPKAIVDGVMNAIKNIQDIEISLYGDQDKIIPLLTFKSDRIKVIHTNEVIGMGEKNPAMAIRQKKESSLVLAMKSTVQGENDVFIGAGSTGAIVAGGFFVVKRIDGVLRPALAPVSPRLDGEKIILMDVGANADAKPEYLEQYAEMASVYSRNVLGVKSPKVGLLNNGTEEGKGRDLEKQTYELMKNNDRLNFVGNIEAKEIMTGDTDVLVMDGFTGNILLKTLEGTAKGVSQIIKQEIKRGGLSSLGGFIAKGAFKRVKKRLDPNEVGGSLLLGCKAPIIKAHGSSDEHAILNAIALAKRTVENKIVEDIKELYKGKKVEL